MLVFIPARGGSKGLPGKNIRLLNGIPLIAYSILAALEAEFVDRVIVSTDSKEIAEVSKSYGAEIPFLRPKELAQDNTEAIDTYCYTIEKLNKDERENYNDFIALLPTAPLRISQDIDNAINIYRKKNADSVISVCRTSTPLEWYLKLNDLGIIERVFSAKNPIANRQDYVKTYIPNGAIYILQYDILKKKRQYYTDKTYPYIMPRERSVDIDELVDFEYAEFLINRIRKRPDDLSKINKIGNYKCEKKI